MSNSALNIAGIEANKNDAYYQHARKEIESLLPSEAYTIVDVGCGVGNTARWLKSKFPKSKVIGLEGFPENETELRSNVDQAYIVDLNGPTPDIGKPDLMLFLDVLEHLPNPEMVLAKLTRTMPIGSKIIVSVPNIANLSVSSELFFRNKFDYRDSGILDRTHMRFFVRDSAVQLVESAGFKVYAGIRTGFWSRKRRIINALTFGMMIEKLTVQLIMVGEKTNDQSLKKINWTRF